MGTESYPDTLADRQGRLAAARRRRLRRRDHRPDHLVVRTLLPGSPTSKSGASLNAVFSCMQAHGWRGFATYQPASRYWPFQGIETGIYVLLAAALIAVTFVIVRRRDA